MTKAVLVGATGEVGSKVLNLLLDNSYYSKIYVLGRSSIYNIKDDEKIEKILIDFEDLNFDETILDGADVFSCLGTGGNGKFATIDLKYPLTLALKCHNRVKSFNIVSAMGANSKSPSYYQKIKGQAEEGLKQYNLGIVRIYRPSMFLALDRKIITKKEIILIHMFTIFKPLFLGPLKNWQGIRPIQIATAMVNNAIYGDERKLYKYEDMVK